MSGLMWPYACSRSSESGAHPSEPRCRTPNGPEHELIDTQPMTRSFFRLPRTVLVLGAVSFMNDVASEMVMPLLPILLTSTLGAGPAVLGLIEGVADATASFTQIVCRNGGGPNGSLAGLRSSGLRDLECGPATYFSGGDLGNCPWPSIPGSARQGYEKRTERNIDFYTLSRSRPVIPNIPIITSALFLSLALILADMTLITVVRAICRSQHVILSKTTVFLFHPACQRLGSLS